MKRTVLSLIILLFLISCASNKNTSYSEEEASYALKYTLSQAILNSDEDFVRSSINSIDFIPQSYRILKENTSNVTGLKRLLSDWSTYFSTYLEDIFNSLSNSLILLSDKIEFEDPDSFVKSSNTSTSEFFLKQYGDEIKQILFTAVENSDTSYLEKARNLFNAYIRVANFANNTALNYLDEADIVKEISDNLYLTYSDLLLKNEYLFRTTPNPYADPVIKAVFGNE